MGMCGGGEGGGALRIITDDMVAAAEIGVRQWNDYQTRMVPFENKFIQDVTRDPGVTSDKVQGMVGADMAQKTSPAAITVNPIHSGAPPVVTGRSLATGMTDARQGALDRTAQGMGTAVAMGRGQQVEALNGMTDLAATSGQIASQKAITDSQVAIKNRGDTFGMIGTAIGAGGAIAKNYKKPAGNLDQFQDGEITTSGALTKGDVMAGQSFGPGGYSVSPKTGAITWNN